MTTPKLGVPELTEGQAIPETTVNEQVRYVEQGAHLFIVKDKDLATPPGSPADGDAYIVAGSPTGAWTGWAKRIAFRFSTVWNSITPEEGFFAWVQDENLLYYYDGSAWAAWNDVAEATAAEIWAASVTNKYVSPDKLMDAAAPSALTSSTSITPDGNNSFNFTLTLAHATTLQNPSNFKVGQSGFIQITQDSGAPWTMAYGTQWKFPGGAPVLSVAAGAIDVIAYVVTASSNIRATLTKAYS